VAFKIQQLNLNAPEILHYERKKVQKKNLVGKLLMMTVIFNKLEAFKIQQLYLNSPHIVDYWKRERWIRKGKKKKKLGKLLKFYLPNKISGFFKIQQIQI
jgi:hypothetical protein